MKYYLCHYVRREDPGDLLWGYNWREAVMAVEDGFNPNGAKFAEVEERMFDKETGKNVGDTGNYCINPHCGHEDCGPMVMLAEA